MAISVLNIPLYSYGLHAAVEHIGAVCTENYARSNRCVSATGAHGIVYSKRNPAFSAILRKFYMNLPDGMPGVWIGKIKGAYQMGRCYGPDFFKDVVCATSQSPIKHYFCGGKEGVANRLKLVCETKYSNRNIVGTYCPPFRELLDSEIKELADDINQKGTDIVWIGISTPKQELLADRLSRQLNVHFIITVGAAFDFHIDDVRQAPRFMQEIGLEWFFRLCIEPKRLFKRYFEIVPLFIYYNICELAYSAFRWERTNL